MDLKAIQDKLPWTIPYTYDFCLSQATEHHRFLIHDIMHIQKSLGKIAAFVERMDHDEFALRKMSREQFANEVADLVICALHIAKTNPLGEFDLEKAVLDTLNRRNGSSLIK